MVSENRGTKAETLMREVARKLTGNAIHNRFARRATHRLIAKPTLPASAKAAVTPVMLMDHANRLKIVTQSITNKKLRNGTANLPPNITALAWAWAWAWAWDAVGDEVFLNSLKTPQRILWSKRMLMRLKQGTKPIKTTECGVDQ
ncbi:hypothetical protein Poly41_10640 [Novipirellula artificiosorum]|uniref:Uncharacterized protein n=1 Tax=Novipirellula artificiosorum TaxID=2528016 RepID=A0A5C6E2N6_9BACT|nr:hypothetical protein Poly41_10640 [Novipirellula artificiosorum]